MVNHMSPMLIPDLKENKNETTYIVSFIDID